MQYEEEAAEKCCHATAAQVQNAEWCSGDTKSHLNFNENGNVFFIKSPERIP